MIMKLFFFLFSSKFLNILTEELYIPYSGYKNPSINSIYGTGNRTLDIIYRDNCAQLCGQKTYNDIHCCEGNTLEEEKCQSFKRCQEILDSFQRFVIGMSLIFVWVFSKDLHHPYSIPLISFLLLNLLVLSFNLVDKLL